MRGCYTCFVLCWLVSSLTAVADPFVRSIEQAKPNQRVIILMNYFDTCQAVTQHMTYAFRLLDSTDALGRQLGDEQLRRYVRFVRETHVKHTPTLTNAQKAALFLRVGQAAKERDDEEIEAVCRYFAGQYYFLNGEYGPAFEHLLAAKQRFQQLGYERIPGVSRYLHELAADYYFFKEYDKAIVLLKETTLYPIYSPNIAFHTFNTLGMTYMNRGRDTNSPNDGKLAERAFVKAIELAATYKDSLLMGIASGNLGTQYKLQNRWAAALRAYKQAYVLIRRFGSQRELPDGEAQRIANAFFQLGQLDSCRYYLTLSEQLRWENRSKEAFNDLNDEYNRMNYYDLARRYHRVRGDLALAYQYLDSATVLRERINKRYNAERMSLVSQKLLIQQHQAEVEAIERKRQFQELLFGGVGVVLALVSLVFFMLYRTSRLRRRQEKAMNLEQEKSLRLQKQIVEDELSRAKADLAVFIDNLQEKNALVDTITSELERLSQTQQRSYEQGQITEAQQNLLNTSLLTNEDWDEFQRRFERVHPHFFIQLRNQLPDITPAEERLLALLKLRVNTRQMGRMLGVLPDSIRTTKYRLRKKLGTTGASPLADLLIDAANQ